jgi:GTP-binding protein 1
MCSCVWCVCMDNRYLKTTIGGMTGHLPDYCMLLIGANMGVTRMTKEHLGLALALRLPLIVVITKIDMCPEHVYKVSAFFSVF